MKINFGNVSNDYAKYRDHMPEMLFEQLKERGIRFNDLNVIELGSGTGIVARDLARNGANVTGIEPSRELIGEAVSIDKLAGVDKISYIEAYAEDFTLPGKYPIFIAVRAWHWFNRIDVLRNIKKYIESNGLLLIINSIFKPESEVAQITFEVLKDNNIELKPSGANADHNERRNGFPVSWFDEWNHNSFQIEYEWEYDYELDFSHDEWCGKIRSVSWLANIEAEKRTKISNELLTQLSKQAPVLRIPHQYSVVILRYGQ